MLSDLESITQDETASVLLHFANKIMADAKAAFPNNPKLESIKSYSGIEVTGEGQLKVTIYFNSNLAAYIEFGTGRFAASYLAGQAEEVSKEAIKFYVDGTGTLQASPYLFPAFYRYRDQIIPEINRRLEIRFRKYA